MYLVVNKNILKITKTKTKDGNNGNTLVIGKQ